MTIVIENSQAKGAGAQAEDTAAGNNVPWRMHHDHRLRRAEQVSDVLWGHVRWVLKTTFQLPGPYVYPVKNACWNSKSVCRDLLRDLIFFVLLYSFLREPDIESQQQSCRFHPAAECRGRFPGK